MTMQNNINIVGRFVRRNMLEPKFLGSADKIDNQRPVEVTVAISANDRHRRADAAQFLQNSFRANITQMPDFIRLLGKDRQLFRKFVVGIGQNKDGHLHLHRCFAGCRS